MFYALVYNTCYLNNFELSDFHGTPSTKNRPIPFIDAFPLTLWLYKQEDSSSPPITQPLARTAQNKRPPPLPPRSSKGQLTKKSEEKTNVAKMHLLLVSCWTLPIIMLFWDSLITMIPFLLFQHITNLVSVQLNHYQFLFLMRLLETVSEITTFLTQDVSHILGESDESSMALGLIAPQVDLSLLMPSLSQQSKENNLASGDYNSLNADQLKPETTTTQSCSLADMHLASTPQNNKLTGLSIFR